MLGADLAQLPQRGTKATSSLSVSMHVKLAQVRDRSFLDVVIENPPAKLRQVRNLSVTLLESLIDRIVSTAVVARFSLNDIRALAAKRFVILQDIGYFDRVSPFEENCKSLDWLLAQGVEAWHGPRRPGVRGAH
jgi:hypothetical protein